ncbi:hypothetical protein Ahu01nite_007650 [Winogradskya humida]|uniref:Sensor histidine kinase NatK-like C-terminal domain-containing protein n=2 Tax=Winogradskya humida TaxID=113566 RepID=A0ABQ3ZGN5_9ACTN|nr:hypothetical protein Ahu01nite_007650 [Actinoplanes humidus]
MTAWLSGETRRRRRESRTLESRYQDLVERLDDVRVGQRNSAKVVLHSTQAVINQVLEEDRLLIAGTPAGKLVQEINHSLNTPLAQIETAVETLSKSERIDDTERKILKQVGQSIEISWAVLRTYRSLTSLIEIDEIDVRELSELVRATFYAARDQAELRQIHCSATLPNKIAGYENYFIVAILLPLLQNAAESAPENSVVKVDFERRNELVDISVRNMCDSPIEALSAARSAKSNKQGKSHEAVGLQTVSTLLQRIRNSSFHMDTTDNEFVAKLTLPSRSS